ncbi:SET domain-containing protein [Skeletonema marinoi]|uniref:SET domain-containing protein n=1 Tax=Skeletonema marinoi TaxID=267567 RepID=A0AAD8Y466_9STRA|nr:SET domain-containing protein [Skeletonema marinoi]
MKASLPTTTLSAALLTTLSLLLAITPPSQSFQTPIIFPLLWLSKQLTSNKNNNPLLFSPPPSHRRSYRLPPPSLRINAIRTTTRQPLQRFPAFILTPFSALFNIVATKLDPKVGDKKLLSWITQESDSSSGTSSISIDTHPTTQLRGLFATRDIRPNELIVEVPYHLALNVGDTLRQDYYNLDNISDEWDEGDVEDVVQALYFLENFVGGASFDGSYCCRYDEYDEEVDSDYFAPYVSTLPSKPIISTADNNNSYDDEEGLTPDFWSDSTINEIGIPSYSQRIIDRKSILRTIAQNNNVDEGDLQWATFMIRSRRFTTWNMVPDPNNDDDGGPFGALTQKKIEQIQGFLVPLIDMANHNPNPNAVMKISVNKWTRKFDDTSSFALRATRPIRKGEEVTISYGDGSGTCLELLDKYGFFVESDEDGADERGVDLEELKPIWRSSVEEDEVELDRLRGGRDSSSTMSSSSNKLKTIVSRLQDEYTFNFPAVLNGNDEMKLIGSGIREKLGINVYAVGMYGFSSLLDAVSPSDLRYKARQFETGTDMTSFVLEMILQAEGKVIAEAIADSVGVRYDGLRLDIEQLENLIDDGISGKGGQAKKGTTLRFDCTKEGVRLSVDGVERGTVKASGLGKAFVDVYLDNNAVSPSLIDSCIENSSIATNAVIENATESDVEGSASRRTMLSLRIWLKRLKKWTKPEEASVVAVSDEGTVSVEVSDEALPSADSVSDSSDLDADTTGEVEETLAVAEVSIDEVAIESTSDDGSSDDVTVVESTAIESTVLESTQAAEQSIEEKPAEVVQPGPEVATVVVSPQNIADIESKLGSGLTDKATSVSFQPKLADGLYLAGVGVRKKAIINVYAVAMYTSPSTLASVATLNKGKDAQAALRDSARRFGPTTPMTSFVLEMTFKADGKTIGEAIGEGVKPRYSGPEGDVKELESLIIEGVKSKGGQATKGTIFRFDCTKDGISVSVDGVSQGQVTCDGIGSALVDVFTDNDAVSQQLVDSCLGTWCGSGLVIEPVSVQPTLPPAAYQDLEPISVEPATAGLPEVDDTPPSTPMQAASMLDKSNFDTKDIATRILELETEIAAEIIRVKTKQGTPTSDVLNSQESLAGESPSSSDTGTNTPMIDEQAAAVESKAKSLKEKATGVSFDPKLEDGLFLVGAGVRKKAIINVYAVAMYSSPTAIASLGSMKKGKDAQSTLRDSSRTFNSLTRKTSFVLEMTFKADGKTIAEAIADGVKPRHSGSAAAVTELENLIVDGVKSKGGQATKGTIFRFDCDAEGVSVSVDGNMQGKVASEGMGSALVDVFMDDKAVSPQLVDSCMETWCGSGL